MREPPLVWYVGGEDVHMRIPLLQKLQQRGFAVAALGSEPADIFDRHGITYLKYPLSRGLSPFSDLKTKSVLKRLFQEGRPDLVHGFDTKPAIFAPTCAKRTGIVGRVRTITGMGYVFSSDMIIAKCLRPVYRYLQKNASRSSGMTIFQNNDDLQYFLDRQMVDANRAAVVKGSGIDFEDFLKRLPSADDGFATSFDFFLAVSFAVKAARADRMPFSSASSVLACARVC